MSIPNTAAPNDWVENLIAEFSFYWQKISPVSIHMFFDPIAQLENPFLPHVITCLVVQNFQSLP